MNRTKRILELLLAVTLLASAGAWTLVDQDDVGRLRQTAAGAVVGRLVHPARLLGPPVLLGLCLLRWRAGWTHGRVLGLRADWRRVDAAWGRGWCVLLAVCLAIGAPFLAVGVNRTVENLELYGRLHCPPEMTAIKPEHERIVRTVRERTPEQARILLVADRPCWLFCYYLHPRRVFERPGVTLPLTDADRQWAAEKRVGWILEHTREVPFRLVRCAEGAP